MLDIYAAMKAAGVPIASWRSDLYAKITPASQRIMKRYRWAKNVRRFTDANGEHWYDIPAAYTPFWEQGV